MTSSLTVRCVTINAREPDALAGFWAGLIGGTPRDAGNDFVLLDPGQGTIPLLFQKSDQPNPRPGWVHLDLSTPDRVATIDLVERLGGRLIAHRSDSHGDWVVLADPEGNPFCI